MYKGKKTRNILILAISGLLLLSVSLTISYCSFAHDFEEEVIEGEYGDVFLHKYRLDGANGLTDNSYEHMLYFNNKKIMQYHSQNKSIMISGIYSDSEKNAYIVNYTNIFLRDQNDDGLVELGTPYTISYDEFTKPIIHGALAEGELRFARGLLEIGDVTTALILQDYARGDFLYLNPVQLKNREGLRNEAKNLLTEYGLL